MQLRAVKKRVIVDIIGVLALLVILYIEANKRLTHHINSTTIYLTDNGAHLDSADTRFVVLAAELNLEEIEFGKLVKTQASVTQLQNIGAAMENNFTPAAEQLKQLASRNSIDMPGEMNSEKKEAYEKLMALSGDNFDLQALALINTVNKNAYETFEQEMAHTYNSDIKKWISTLLPQIKKEQADISEYNEKL